MEVVKERSLYNHGVGSNTIYGIGGATTRMARQFYKIVVEFRIWVCCECGWNFAAAL